MIKKSLIKDRVSMSVFHRLGTPAYLVRVSKRHLLSWLVQSHKR